MADFNLSNAVPVMEENGAEVRSAPFSLSNAEPVTPPLSVPEMLGKNLKKAGVETLQEVGKVASVIRWPLDRFIWYPIGTTGEQVGSALAGVKVPPPSGKEFLHEPLAPLTRIWDNYWRASSGRNTPAPDWYKQIAVGAMIGAAEPGILSGAAKGAEVLATRAATPEEAATIKNAFAPLKASLAKVGIDSSKLHADGNIVSLSNDSELFLNKHLSAVLRGDEIRVPRWLKVNTTDATAPGALPAPETLPMNHLETLPLTTRSIVPTPAAGLAAKLADESGQVIIPPVAEFLKASVETLPTTKDLEQGFVQLKTQAEADDLRARQLLEQVDLTPQDAEQIYHHVENPQEPLTAEQQKMFDENIKPLADKSAELFAKLKNDGIPIPSEGYTPRFIEGRGNTFDRIKSGVQNIGSGVSGLFKKTSPSFKTRTMKILVDEQGSRQVVSIKKDEVVAWTDKKPTPLGKINSQENEDLLAKELKPINSKIKALETEERILMAGKGRQEASVERLKNIQTELMALNMQRMETSWKYNPENLEQKVFVDKNGKKWTVSEATTREIEAHTDLTYHKNVLLNNLVHYNELRKIDRATQYLEEIKNNPEFQKFSMKIGSGNPPTDWKSTSLPQFRGYYLEPRIADTLDYFSKQLYKGRDPIAVLTGLNRFLRTAIFFNPLIHIPNIATHWITARGVSGVSPATWGRLAKTSGRAIEAVLSQNKDYLDMLDSGVNLMYHHQSGETLAQLMLDKMGQELRGNDKLFQMIKKTLGGINPYNISGKITWAANDVATLQAIFEEMEKGKTQAEAIEEVGKHIPNYVVPSRVLNSKALSVIMTNPNVTLFGNYHYGALKSYGEMIKSLLGKVPLKERAEAADKLGMLGLLLFVLYPALDRALQAATGDKNAHIRRAGSTTLPDNIAKLVEGKIDYAQLFQSVLTPAVGAKEAIETGFNRDLFTGKRLIQRGQEGAGVKDLVVKSIAPLTAVQRITDQKISLKNYLLSLGGISFTDLNKGKLYSMKEAKAEFQKRVDKNPDGAAKMAESFNTKQMRDLNAVLKEEGIDELPRSVINEFIISKHGEPAGTKSVEDILSKPKRRKRFSILGDK